MLRRAVAAVLVIGCHASDPAPAPVAKPEVQLVSPGAAPRRVLAYVLPKGTQTHLELAIDMTLDAGGRGGTLPTVVMQLDVAVDDVLADHRMKLRTTIADASVRDPSDSQVAAAIATPLEQIKGLAVTTTLAPDGKVSDAKLDPGGKQLTPAAQQQYDALAGNLEDLALRLPTEPVGMGAKWRSSRQVHRGGLATTATATVEVTKLEGTHVGYAVAIDSSGPDQTINQAGASVDVKHIHGTGQGTGILDLATLATTGELALDLASEMAMQGDATPMKMTVKMTTTPK